ncbi:MAG: replication and repair protein RecF [Armatimonadetes bacterium]|jgi:DNA replication and repair protein RecF|nr:replication and repair protein RecF [Armatimonadota bacterium]
MILRHLSLLEYRNYPSLQQEFSPSLNVLVGPNAQGKSNLLEAVYLLATSKSMRGSKDIELIRWDHPSALVSGQILRDKTNDTELEVALSRTEKKSLVVNTIRVTRAMDFIGQLKAVSFSISDLDVVRGEPTRRRRFLDLEISQLSPSYCHSLSYYRKITEQRNRLLKMARDRSQRGSVLETLSSWNDQLVTYGSKIVERRKQFLKQLQEFAHPVHGVLTDQQERLSVVYHPSFKGPEDLEGIQEAYRQALSEVREEELRRQVSLIGPHRDDVVFLVNGRDIRTFGSQGQQRTVALSVKLAEVELMRDLTGEPPVCLLDDVFSELDAQRRAHIFDVTLNNCQTFLSTTDVELLPASVLKQAQLFRTREGELTPDPAAGPDPRRRSAA